MDTSSCSCCCWGLCCCYVPHVHACCAAAIATFWSCFLHYWAMMFRVCSNISILTYRVVQKNW